MKKTKRIIYLFVIIFSLAVNPLLSQPMNNYKIHLVSETSIFSSADFEACHSSTIVEISPDTLMAAWFAGSHEGANDVGIWISNYTNKTWSAPKEIVKGYDSLGNQLPCWNPVLFKTNDNKLVLFYKVGPNPREWWGCAVQSIDNGISWSKSIKLPEGFLGPIKNKPLQLTNGKIFCPSSVETTDGEWSTHLEICDNNLSTWEKIKIQKDDSVGVIQPTIIKHNNGKFQMLCRSKQNVIYETWSKNDGFTWSELKPSKLPNPNSGIDAVSLHNGKFILVYNPLLSGNDWWNGRNVLNAAVSDDGQNWINIYQLENEMDGEFSYPAVIQASDNSIHITYTNKRKTIKHVVLKLD
ncbi:MAG: exo-alpha-sialidase [Bacteroidetes bacterium]|nr:exo-alpha-sialidase [Bacteroidota bacterium]MBU1116423.1 exo-alpha-sialidase [Bacteroidota bacterium]MBU1800002.1 exo-alpha-sialidase [Bacteroidota bacterium]